MRNRKEMRRFPHDIIEDSNGNKPITLSKGVLKR